MAMILFTKLDEEWAWLAHAKHTKPVLETWKASHPVLAGFRDLGELITFVQRRDQVIANDRVHAALVALAATDQLAARTMLCAIQPGLVAIAMQYRTAGDCQDDIASAVVGAAIERIRTYPIRRRPAKIAANVLLDTRQIVTRALFRPHVEQVVVPDWSAVFAVPVPERDAPTELRLLLDEALRRGQIAGDELRLIVLTRLGGVTCDELAAREGGPVSRVYQRRHRAERALALGAV